MENIVLRPAPPLGYAIVAKAAPTPDGGRRLAGGTRQITFATSLSYIASGASKSHSIMNRRARSNSASV